jgi:glutathione S-transferase
MLLYEHPLSSYAQKVKIALREKGLTFDLETPPALGSGNSTGPFAAASPRLEVPTLVDGDARIFDSTIIMEYLEDKHPSPALLPRDPLARAEARMIEDLCDTLYEAINWGLGEIRWFKRAEGRLADTMQAKAASQTRELLEWLAGKLGTKEWFGGATFGWADLSVAPYLNRLCARPSVAATFKEFEAATQGMANAHERLTSGAIRREYRDHRLEWMMKSGGVQVVLDGLAKDNIRFTWPLG